MVLVLICSIARFPTLFHYSVPSKVREEAWFIVPCSASHPFHVQGVCLISPNATKRLYLQPIPRARAPNRFIIEPRRRNGEVLLWKKRKTIPVIVDDGRSAAWRETWRDSKVVPIFFNYDKRFELSFPARLGLG